ncbi:hypothetical protein BDQ12DRAFT_692592 [Crucibulum laeve]|uniref:TLC domain-containing protein n=1 Tax=Crucibulum laeve TaxID=68775 RepID=A0A5C3LHX3_9AGAR|nr:hypothetical protein BDQ12DRAFT_692592 [Crucibulum laeve]
MVGLKAISLLFPLSFPQIRDLAPPISTATLLSFAALGASYHILAPQYSTQKQLSWILTTVSSAVMTIMSLPFMYDYFMHGGRVQYIRTLSTFSIAAVRFFQGYLAADLTIGTVYYRDQLSTLTGWIHHLVYILVVELAVRRSWTHIFCLAAIMEVCQ